MLRHAPEVRVGLRGGPCPPEVMATAPTHSGLERLLTVIELSEYLGIPVATLYDWRVDGVGPRAVKLGRSLRYPESCVRAWIEEKLRG